MGLKRNRHSGLGFAHSVVDINVQNTMKELVQKITYSSGPLSSISSDQGMYFTVHQVQRWVKRYHIKWTNRVAFHPQSNGLLANWNR